MKYKLQPKDEKCHHLYTLWAFEHINAAVECLEKLDAFSNSETLELSNALFFTLQKKIYTNPAYNEAFKVLCKINPEKFNYLVLKNES